MNANTSGALLVAILAVAGFAWGSPVAVWACIATCAAAFLAEQARDLTEVDGGLEDAIGAGFALASWVGVAVAAFALTF